MHLKSLELTGFKSFAEAKIEFPQGITCVVGPNGTGKSNVVDAILWVLGEQSAKTLRSEHMEDVIFNGTEIRKPLGMAEVSLTMSGVGQERLDGVQPLPHQLGEYDEVMVTRRLYRNGDSEYLINKTPCRLKDIRSLFLDSRAGTKGHTIIEQGRIEQILNASPQDRRELIEETAGIVRYKKQKAEALRKLDSTQQNLLRVRDIIAEVKRQLNSLERQARQARAYQTLQQDAKTLEIRLLVRECRALMESRRLVEAELGELDRQEASLASEHGRLDGDCERLKLTLLAGNDLLSRIRDELAQVEHDQALALTASEVEKSRLVHHEQQRAQAGEELARLAAMREQADIEVTTLRDRLAADQAEVDSSLSVCAELDAHGQVLAERRMRLAEEERGARQHIISLTIQATNGDNTLANLASQDEAALRRIERLSGESAELETQHASTTERLQQTTAEREAVEHMVQGLRGEAVGVGQEIARLGDHARELDGAVARQQEELAAVESRVRALQGVLREEMGYGRAGEEESTSLRAACQGVRDSLAEWLVVPPGLERAVEAILGERVRAWLVETPAQARRAVEFLNRNGLGRGAFLPLQPRCGAQAAEQSWWPLLQGQRGVRGRAIELVNAGAESRDVLTCVFAGVVIVNSLEVAVEQWERGLWSAPDGPTLVTIDGEVMDAAGVITGGTAGTTGGLLLRRREIARLEDERANVSRSLDENRTLREQVTSEFNSRRAALQQLEESMRAAEMRGLGLNKDEAAFRQTLDDLARRIDTIRTERKADEHERVGIQGEIELVREQVAQLVQQKAEREGGLTELQAVLKQMEEESAALQQRVTESRMSLASLKARLEHGQADLTRGLKEQDERERRAAALEEQRQGLDASIEHSRRERERMDGIICDLDQRAGALRASLVSAQEAYAEDAAASQEAEKTLASVRVGLSANREARTSIEVRRAEIATQLSMRESTLVGTYQLTVALALAQEPAEPKAESDADAEHQKHDLKPDDASEIRAQLGKIREKIERLGPINLAAIEEHRELDERHRFLTAQEEDLSRSVSALKEIITRINRITKEMFLETFNELQLKFREVFGRFFPGGRAELVLTEAQVNSDPAPGAESGSLEPGVDIVAQPPGKRLKSIAMLSGGEKTLTAMALIFASFLIRPTPFCILDEIDAPLDEENIGRFTGVLRELSTDAQFIVITHNKRTMAVADSLFGVTMEDPGISKLVSVRLADLQPA